LIGGFAGISLFSEAAKRINMQVVDQIKAQTNAQGQLITAIKEGNDQESEIRLILNRVVDPSIDISPSEAERLRQAILKSPIQVRNIVFEKSQQSLQINRILGVSDLLGTPEIQAKLAQLDSLLPVFKDLEDAARQENPAFNGVNVNGSHGDINLHRYVAHQGFVHKQLAIGHSLLGEAGQASQDSSMPIVFSLEPLRYAMHLALKPSLESFGTMALIAHSAASGAACFLRLRRI